MGWTVEVTEEHPDKYIICLAPHTSNWDFILGLLYSRSIGMKSNFLMKKEWFFWPLGPIFRSLGGIPVYRQKKMSMTDAMAETAKAADTFYGLDYEQKRIQCTKTIIPSGDLDRDMRDIKLYYQHFKGKKPENFTIGELV